MEAKEFRIGNLVYDSQKRVVSIDIIHSYKGYLTHPFDERYNDFSPIPLTEDLLLKFGFERDKFYIPTLYYNSKLRIKNDERGFWVNACYNFVLIKYVHQLQNLYFALTGEELTLKD